MRKNNSTISKSQQFPYNRNNAFMPILLGGILVACMMYFILRNPAWVFYAIIVFACSSLWFLSHDERSY